LPEQTRRERENCHNKLLAHEVPSTRIEITQDLGRSYTRHRPGVNRKTCRVYKNC